MAKNLKVNGIIIAESNSGDSDKMLTMLTPNLGKISCTAKRSKKNKKSVVSCNTDFHFWRVYAFQRWRYIYDKFL